MQIPLMVMQPAPGIRQRRIGSAPVEPCHPTATTWSYVNIVHVTVAPAVFLFLSVSFYLFFGILCIQYPPLATTAVGDIPIPEQVVCLRTTRYADYATVHIPMLTPAATMEALIRFDSVNGSSRNLRLFSTRIAESNTVSCVHSLCTDVAVLQTEGPNSHGVRGVISFEYTNPLLASTFPGFSLKYDGEFYMSDGHDYFFTATHLCYREITQLPEQEEDLIRGYVNSDGLLETNDTLLNNAVSAASPVAQVQNSSFCNLTNIALFPYQASVESTWLQLNSLRLYEFAGTGISDRRNVIEVGSECAPKVEDYARAHSLFSMECQRLELDDEGECKTTPSLPYRRLARSEFRLSILSNEVRIWAYGNVRLENLPKFAETVTSVWMSVLQLAVMTLTAGIVWIRSSKRTSSVQWLYIHSVKAAFGKTSNTHEHKLSWYEDMTIGLLAIVARVGIAFWRWDRLLADDQMRVALSELIISCFSLLHWCLRYWIIDSTDESPLTKLGGSTAIVDASCSVMVAFAEAPLMVISTGRFDPTARLLTSILLTLTVISRCLFASASCGVRWAAAKDNPDCTAAYVFLVFTSGVMWICQSVSVSIIMADLFSSPVGFSASRGLVGDPGPVALVIFMTITVTGMPQLMRTCRQIVESMEKKPVDNEGKSE